MNFKKIISFVLICVLLLTFVTGCKSKDTDDVASVQKEDVIDTDITDKSEENQQPEDNQEQQEQKEEQQEQQEEQQVQQEQKEEEQEQPENNEPQEKPDNEKQNNIINTPVGMDRFEKPQKEEETVVEYDDKNLLKIIDYNIRCVDDGENKKIVDRAPRLNALVEKYDPDIMGLQEARASWISQLESYFGDEYEMRYKYRAESSKEATPILWKKDKFELLDEGYFWLSETPDVESLGWGSQYHRILNWVKLKVKATGKIFIFANTHFSNSQFTVNSAPIIEERLKKVGGFTDYPVILTGDFNCTPWSDGVYSLTEIGLADINDSLGFDFSYTNNGYNERPDDDKNNSIKDYVMHSSDKTLIVPLVYKVLNENYFNGWISDHRGLYTELALL